jgi:ATP-dependent Clp protease ATP-binding subunit ClpC
MSEYMEKFNVSRLIGAPPGYVGYEEGGQLTEKIRRRPYAVVCLDEIEKAHQDVFNMLLQIMEEGRLTDSFGRNVDFRNTILIMTSNIGAELLRGQGQLGFGRTAAEQSYEVMKQKLLAEVNRHFRPEFLNRLDDTVVFHHLTRDDLVAIVEVEMARVRQRLVDRGLNLELAPEAKAFLIDRGYNAEFGARPLKRTIERLVEDPLSEEILRGSFQDADTVVVGVRDDHLAFTASRSAAPTEVPEPVKAEPNA